LPESTTDGQYSLKNSVSFIERHRFWIILFSAAVISQLPLISIPFKWLETYFHEISHGLAAVATGGNIAKIELFPNGAGLCTTQGGSRFFISFMGYAGAAIWGTLIYLVASTHQRVAQLITALIATMLCLTLIFWVADLLTFFIIVTLLLITLAKFKFSKVAYLQISLQVTGALVLMNSIKSPWYLIDGRNFGDGAALANLTGLPEILWVFIWFMIGISGIILLIKNQKIKA
jgi:hypothetical protein